MAEAKNATFDGIMHDLQQRQFLPVYYLMGEEPYYIDSLALMSMPRRLLMLPSAIR